MFKRLEENDPVMDQALGLLYRVVVSKLNMNQLSYIQRAGYAEHAYKAMMDLTRDALNEVDKNLIEQETEDLSYKIDGYSIDLDKFRKNMTKALLSEELNIELFAYMLNKATTLSIVKYYTSLPYCTLKGIIENANNI